MKNISRLYVLLIALIVTSCADQPEEIIKAEGLPPAIIPLPNTAEWGENMYLLPADNILCFNAEAKKAAEGLQTLLQDNGITPELTEGNSCGNINISLESDLAGKLNEEGYILDVSQEGVNIKSATEAGLFYAIQTLKQLLLSKEAIGNSAQDRIFLREVHIEDEPAYNWRGTMVDVARSFFGLEYLKKHVDRMAFYKLNRLHLHLSDDQGWRIEIKSWPKLTEIGSTGSVKNGNSGFLTQEEYKELQDYALARNVIVIPEIDVPGHTYAALRSYPELNCPDYENLDPQRATPPEAYTDYRVGWSRLCIENPEIYTFVSDVIGELADITKGPWIHIGGDEIEDPLYEEFVVKADSIVQHHGKTAIGWEEVTKAPVSSSLISQEWAGNTESIVDVKVIQSICSHFYLDHANVPGQEHTNNWCKESGVSLEDVYSFESNDPNVIGVEAAVWTEYVINEEMLDDRFWPRTTAVAEIGWTTEEKRNFENFVMRLSVHKTWLDEMEINFFESPEVNWPSEEVPQE